MSKIIYLYSNQYTNYSGKKMCYGCTDHLKFLFEPEMVSLQGKDIMVVETKKLLNLFEMFLLVPHLKEKISSAPHMMNHMSIHLSVTVSMVCKAFE